MSEFKLHYGECEDDGENDSVPDKGCKPNCFTQWFLNLGSFSELDSEDTNVLYTTPWIRDDNKVRCSCSYSVP
jgi:hypothetical protein